MKSLYSLLHSSIPFKRLSRSAPHTKYLLRKLKTESNLSSGSNTDFVTAKSDLLHSVQLDTNSFLNKFFQDNFGLNVDYKLIRLLKTTYSSLLDEMVREEKKFKGNKEQVSVFNNFFVNSL